MRRIVGNFLLRSPLFLWMVPMKSSTQDSRMAARYIPRGARAAILKLVRDALVALVSLTKAEVIYRVTKGRNLPKKALRKHHFLTEALRSCGYRVAETGTDDFGR